VNATDEAERALERAEARLTQATAALRGRVRESNAGAGPPAEGYRDAVDASLKAVGEYGRALQSLRDLLERRLRGPRG
jgi:hypothetical protein